MEDVELMMQKGLSLMRDYYTDLSILTSPNMDTTALQAVKIPRPFRQNKLEALQKLKFSSMDTAYDRYHNWYNETQANLFESEEVRARKRKAAEVFGDDQGPAMNTRSRMRARRGVSCGVSASLRL